MAELTEESDRTERPPPDPALSTMPWNHCPRSVEYALRTRGVRFAFWSGSATSMASQARALMRLNAEPALEKPLGAAFHSWIISGSQVRLDARR
jgi:hypothetical protein